MSVMVTVMVMVLVMMIVMVMMIAMAMAMVMVMVMAMVMVMVRIASVVSALANGPLPWCVGRRKWRSNKVEKKILAFLSRADLSTYIDNCCKSMKSIGLVTKTRQIDFNNIFPFSKTLCGVYHSDETPLFLQSSPSQSRSYHYNQ